MPLTIPRWEVSVFQMVSRAQQDFASSWASRSASGGDERHPRIMGVLVMDILRTSAVARQRLG